MRLSNCLIQRFVTITDSVEEGEKIVKTAIDNFGRIGEFNLIPIDVYYL